MVRPPVVARRLLTLLVPSEDRAEVLTAMDDLYAARRARRGRLRADAWYVRAAGGFLLRLAMAHAAGVAGGMRAGLDSVGFDLRHAIRVLARKPGYVVASATTLILGLGGLGTVYTAANWVLLRPVPGIPQPEGLATVMLGSTESWIRYSVSHPDFEELRDRLSRTARLAASAPAPANVELGDAAPARISAEVVSDAYFEVLGVRALAGRLLGPPDAVPGAASVVVSERIWRTRLGADRTVVGRRIRVNGRPYTVVGVAADGFRGAELPGATDLWFSTASVMDLMTEDHDPLGDRFYAFWDRFVAKLEPGATAEAVAIEANRAMEAIRSEYTMHSFLATHFELRAYAGVGLPPELRAPVSRTLGLLALAALFLLVLTSANAANLGLMHAASRRTPHSIARALGAGPVRMLRQVLTEHVLLAVPGAVGAVILVLIGTRAFEQSGLSVFGASLEGMQVDARVCVFIVALALCATLISGLIPAIVTGRDRVYPHLGGARHGDVRGGRVRAVLVAIQIAVSLVLVVGAGLLASTVINLRRVDPGFDAESLVTFSLDPRLQGYDEARVRDLIVRLELELEAEPGVQQAGFIAPAPFNPWFVSWMIYPDGGTAEENGVRTARYDVTGSLIEALGVPLLAGRHFTSDEWSRERPAGTPGAVILTESAARRTFPDVPLTDIVGRAVRRPPATRDPDIVVGIVGDIRVTGVIDTPTPITFRPWSQGSTGGELTAYVRTRPAGGASPGRIRDLLRRVDSALPPYDVRTAREQLDRLIVEQRILARLALVLATIGLLLAAVGLHGVLGYAVLVRRREFGVRAALGASSRDVVSNVVTRGLWLTAAGAGPGLLGAAIVARAIRSRLFDIAPFDARIWLGGAVLLFAISALATWVPSRRAMSVSPVEVLRAD